MSGIDTLGKIAGIAVIQGARDYLKANKLTADDTVLKACAASWMRAKMPEALKDAKDALACGLAKVAEQTFVASMMLAGIEAAKEAAVPVGGCPVIAAWEVSYRFKDQPLHRRHVRAFNTEHEAVEFLDGLEKQHGADKVEFKWTLANGRPVSIASIFQSWSNGGAR